MDERLSRDLWLSHLERVLALSDANRELLGPADRREIALELGISEADLALADELADDHYQRGTGFADQTMWDDAIAELTDALALAPERVDVMTALAHAHGRRFAEGNDEPDASEARRFARFALQADPDNELAFKVLSQLQTVSRARVARRRVLMITLAAVGVLSLGSLALLARDEPEPQPSATVDLISTPPPVPAEVPAPPPTPEPPPPPSEVASGECPRGTAFEAGQGCVLIPVIATPGVGVGPIVIGESRPADVLAAYGEDCKVSRHTSGEVFSIDYYYKNNEDYAASSRANRSRPHSFSFKKGELTEINVGVYNKALQTPGGLHIYSTKADMLAELGHAYELKSGEVLDEYRYDSHGVEVWVNRQSEQVTSFKIIAKL